ncbi:MAG: PTS sugar transporter subunit IIA [Planctomycetaceae bacterium]
MKRIRETFESGAFLLDLDAENLDEVFRQSVLAMVNAGLLSPENGAAIEQELHRREEVSSTAIGNAVAIPHAYLDGVESSSIFFVRLRRGVNMGAPDLRPTRYVFILVGPKDVASEHLDTLTQIARCMSDREFRFDMRQAMRQSDLIAALDAFEERIAPESRTKQVEDGLAYTGQFAGGLLADIKRRLASYWSDFRDGLHPKSLGSVLFLYFACLAPTITFGGLMESATGGRIGAMEMLLATAVGGFLFSLFGGQPLLILGGTGPHLVFTKVLYELCVQFQLPFLPTYAWVGCWSAIFLIILSLTDASCLLKFFTRFTDEIFAVLISVIFIQESLKSILRFLHDAHAEQIQHDTAFLALLLSLGTFAGAMMLSRFRKTRYLSRTMREFLADFGPTIALGSMMAFGMLFPAVEMEQLRVPNRLEPTASIEMSTGNDSIESAAGSPAPAKRPWLVSMFSLPTWVWFASAIPALLVTMLTFLEQNITARIINSPDNQLKKGPGYHLDLFGIGVLRFLCSICGLPWLVAATVRSLNHVRSLATVEEKSVVGGETREEIIHVNETRLTGMAISLLIGLSLFLLPLLKMVPIAVLYGLFLYMGVVSLGGNQFFERLVLWITDPNLYPKTHYTRTVPKWTIHRYTAIQVICLVSLMLMSWSSIKVLFPLLIALLIPVRLLIGRWFKSNELAALDAATEPGSEDAHWM